MGVWCWVAGRVVVLDANNTMAGKTLQLDLQVVSIERGS